MGAAHRAPTDGRAAAHHPRRRACTHRLRARRPERAGEERGAPGRSARRRHDHVVETGATRDHTERALRGVRRPTSSVDGLTVSVAGGQRLRAIDARVPGDLLVGGVLAGRRRGAARLARRDRGRRPEPDARPALLDVLRAVRRARRPRGRRPRRARRAARHGRRRARSRSKPLDIAPEEVPGLIDELPAIAALGRARRRVTVRGAARAARQGKRPHRRAGRRLPRARHRRRRARRRLSRARAGRPARRGGTRRRARRSPHGDGVRHRRARRRAARRPSTAPTPSRSRIPASSRRSSGSSRVKADKVYLVGFMAAGKTTRGAGAGAGGSTGRPWTSTSCIEAARTPHGRRDLRPAGRGVLPRGRARRCSSTSCRAAISSSPPAAAPSSTPQNRAAINRDGVSVWLDVPLDRLIDRVPADGRRPLAADRAEFERLYHHAARGLRAGARPARCRPRQRRRAGRAARRLAGARDMRYLVLTDIHAQPRSARRLPGRRAARGYDADARARRPGRLRRRSERRHRARPRAEPRRSSAATTTRSPCGARAGRRLQCRRAERRAAGRSTSLTPENRDWLAALPEGPIDVDDARRDLPRLAVRRGRLHLRRARRRARARRSRRGRSACSATRTIPVAFELSRRSVRQRRRRTAEPQLHVPIARRLAVPDQPRIGRPAARRRSARRLTRSSTRRRARVELFRVDYPVEARRQKIVKAGLPEVLAQTSGGRDVELREVGARPARLRPRTPSCCRAAFLPAAAAPPRRRRARRASRASSRSPCRRAAPRDEDEVAGGHLPCGVAPAAPSVAHRRLSTLFEPPPDRPDVDEHRATQTNA